MIAELFRMEETEEGTIGVLRIDNKVFCATLELPDKDNKREESCIPEGTYWCNKYLSPKYSWTWIVSDIPGRKHILFHAGNTADDTKGCILLGQHAGKLGEKRAVLNSGATFTKFKEYCEENALMAPLMGFTLIVRSI